MSDTPAKSGCGALTRAAVAPRLPAQTTFEFAPTRFSPSTGRKGGPADMRDGVGPKPGDSQTVAQFNSARSTPAAPTGNDLGQSKVPFLSVARWQAWRNRRRSG
jgi:hypothetical protein